LEGPFNAEDVSLSLVDLFDWTPMGYTDLRYYLVLIESFRRHPDRVGHHALVDVIFMKIFWLGNRLEV
jgi:hypothetical protein